MQRRAHVLLPFATGESRSPARAAELKVFLGEIARNF
jgi:hypothetical protein